MGIAGDLPIVSGESGAAGLAGLLQVMREPALARQLGLDQDSRRLLISTEDATAPVYEELVGKSHHGVLARQRAQQDAVFATR